MAAGEQGLDERVDRAERALEAYRERRRRRRGEDTWFGSGACLLAQTESGLDADERSRRRMDLVDEAVAEGMAPELAEMMYDVAVEEGLDPVLARELVRCGLGVAPPDGGVENAPEAPVTDKYRPEWLQPPVPPDDVLRERMLRFSFRRLRGLLEAHPRPEDAFRAFATEPDVGVYGY